MIEKLTTYDPAVVLVDDEEITFFMADAFETGDSAFIAKALGVVARAKGMLGTVKDAELSNRIEHRKIKK
jgi:probable addiction module antidote protein